MHNLVFSDLVKIMNEKGKTSFKKQTKVLSQTGKIKLSV